MTFVSRRFDWAASNARPRQCVFAATTESDSWPEGVGNTSDWWPVRCTTIKLGELAENCDQLWAEAATRYNAGEFQPTGRIATIMCQPTGRLAHACPGPVF
jgi:hypothetical protein